MRFPTLLVLSSLAVVAGCSSESSEAPPALTGWQTAPATSGTRLRAKFVTAGDARELVGFFDTARNEDCTFQPAETGRTRCLPANVVYAQSGLYSDAACTTPVGVTSVSCSADAKYARGSTFDGTCGTARPTPLRRILDAAASRYSNANGPCTPVQPPAQPSTVTQTFVTLGDEVPWTEFVEATETNAEIDGLTERLFAGADGSRQHVGFRDPKRDVDCTFEVMGDGSARCVPKKAATGAVFYADAACSKASFVIQPSTSGQPCATTPDVASRLWVERAQYDGQCAPTRAVYALNETAGNGSEVPSSYARQLTSSRSPSSPSGGIDDGETCSLTPSTTRYGSSTNSRRIDAEITFSLPFIERTGRGSGRLVRALVAKPGSRELELGWHDNERNADCSFERASDGKLRCIPTAAEVLVFGTDDACAAPGVRYGVLQQPSCVPSTNGYGRVTSTTCPPTTRVFALGSDIRTLQTASTETTPGRCAKVAGVTNAYDANEVDPTQFVEGIPVTE